MQKHELIGITLDKLTQHFTDSPESFEFGDGGSMSYTYPTITFRPKIQLSDHSATLVPDPNNEHAVVVVFNTMTNELTCHLYMKAPIIMNGSTADVTISSTQWFQKWRSNYRKFKKLRNMIMERDQFRYNSKYLKKLSSVFPDTLIDDMLK